MFRGVLSFAVGLALTVAPGRASLTWAIGDTANNSAGTAISNWDAASGLNYLVQETSFMGASLSGTPASYLDAASGILFTGFNLSGGTNGTTDSLAVSGTTLQQIVTGGIVELTNFPSTMAFAANFALAQFTSNIFCIEVNHSSFNQSTNCDNTFAMSSSSDVVFVGITSDVPITNVWVGPLGAQAEKIQINNFDAGGSAAPEGSTLILLGGGLTLIGAIRRRRTRLATEH